MDRVIKFRGLRTDGNGWIYGWLFRDGLNGKMAIQQDTYETMSDTGHKVKSVKSREVIPSSVGQFTGLTDSNGVDIYVGDKIKFTKGYCDDTWTDTEQGKEYQVIWDESSCGYRANRGRNYLTIMQKQQLTGKYIWTWEVIGNIHEESEVQNG